MKNSFKLSLQLIIGLKQTELFDGQRLLGEALMVNFVMTDDLEQGGIHYIYIPKMIPDTGITEVYLFPNRGDDLKWRMPHRKDIRQIAEINLVGSDLLELGRLTVTLRNSCGHLLSICGYRISVTAPSSATEKFWRAHWVNFASDEDAAPQWNRKTVAKSAHTHDWFHASNIHLCHLTMGFEESDLSATENFATALFDVSFRQRNDKWFGGRYLEYAPTNTAPGEIASILIRPNQLNQWTWLYPDRQECPLLLDITQYTANLLELGRIVAAVENQSGNTVRVVAYRVIGDLLGDRIPRMLMREFSSVADATSTWRSGHERFELQQDEEDEYEEHK